MISVGIKYCGGCGPRYDRTGLLNEFMEAHPEYFWQTVNDGLRADYWLVLCGCGSACADTSLLKAERGMIVLDSPESFEGLAERLV